MRTAGFVAAFALCTVALSGCQPDPTARPGVGESLTPVTITTAKGRHVFRVEIVRTPDEQARGLMFRTSIAPDYGMLFPFDVPRVASFWMKNTPSSLDIIFIRADGTIANIATDTVPYSLDQILSDGPVSAVLEVAAGRTSALGIAAGDRVALPQ